MTERSKKILFATFFIAVSVGMGYGLYYVFFRGTAPTVTTPPGQQPGYGGNLAGANKGVSGTVVSSTEPGSLPTGGETPGGVGTTTPGQATDNLHVLRDEVTQNISPSKDGQSTRFYSPEDGRFYRINADGSVTVMSDKQFFNVDNVSWGKQDDQAILEFPDGQNVYYDFKENRQVTLPQHWQEFDFSPDDSRVASKSIGTDPDNRFLITSKPDGTEAKAIEPLGDNANDAHVSWSPNGQVIAYSMTGSPQTDASQEVVLIGQNHENFSSIIAPGQDFLPNWSPTGKQLLFSTWSPATNNEPSLWLTSGDPNKSGKTRRTLNLNTWADKCTWAGDNDLYCGVPQNLPPNAGLQRNDYATYPDDVYHVNLATGLIAKIPTPEATTTVKNPVVNRDKSKLIYTDAATGKLYSLDLK